MTGRIELERGDAKHGSSASNFASASSSAARKATGSMDADSSLPSSRKVVPHALRGLAAAPRLALLPPPVSQVGRMQSVGSMALDIRELDDDYNGSGRASGRGSKGRKSSDGSVPAVPAAAVAVPVPVPAGVARLKAGLAGAGSGSRSGSISTAPGTRRNSMASQKGEKADGKSSGSRFSGGGDGGGSGGSGSKKSDRKEKVLVCTFCKVLDKSGRGEKVRAITECGGSALCEGCIGQMFKEGGGLVWRANGPGK